MKFKELFNEDWSVNWEKINEIPQFGKMFSTKQSTIWHREGNAYLHTILVTQQMEKLLEISHMEKGTYEWIMCMSAALCHDLGKVETTKWSNEKNDYTAKNHSIIGERITRELFCDEDIILRELVCYMVRHHMTLHHILDENKEVVDKKLIKMSHGIVPLRYMLYLNKSDALGSINEETDSFIETKCNKILSKCAALDCFDMPYSIKDKSQLIRSFIGYNGEVINEGNDFCVYILCGFPGCGKSTYYEKYLKKHPIISRDIIRGELGIGGATVENGKKVVGTKEEEQNVSEVFNTKMISYCEKKTSFVLDNTNLKYQYRKDYLTKIMKYNPKIKIIYVEAPDFINDCINRRDGQIDKSVYDRMKSTFDFPQLYECDNLVIYKQYKDKDDEEIEFKSNFCPQNIKDRKKFTRDLSILKGKIIMDGYNNDDQFIKYVDNLIEKYKDI